MPRILGSGSGRLLLSLLVLVLVFGFTPISKGLLRAVDGSFAPSSYSSLALRNPAEAITGISPGTLIRVNLANHTGRTKTYHWSASQVGSLISLGAETLQNGKSATILVPSRGAVTGSLQISLTGTNVFVTVPVLKS
jgi:hypothetical protein